VRVTVATSLPEVESLRSLWARLLEHSRATLFQTFEWNLLVLQTFAEENPYFVAVEMDSSAAILPAIVRDREIRLAGGPLFDYRDAICAGDEAACAVALAKVDELGLPWNVFGIPSADRWFGAQSWTAAPFVSLRAIPAEAFAEKHTRARRSLRRLIDEGASVRVTAGTPDLIEHIYREKAKEPSDCGQNVFRDPRCILFMREVVQLPQTRCDTFLMEIASEPIGALVTFLDGQIRRFYTTWMDHRWSQYSPGIALLYEATCQTLAAGLDCDYMTGEQPYKLRFATGSVPLYKVEAAASAIVTNEVEVLKAA
jgi:CelD/BcsL family acetyltransferase involved in cellulose biosynthesis